MGESARRCKPSKRAIRILPSVLPVLKPSLDFGDPPLSYTQWEAYLAVYHGKVLLIAAAAPEAPRDGNHPIDFWNAGPPSTLTVNVCASSAATRKLHSRTRINSLPKCSVGPCSIFWRRRKAARDGFPTFRSAWTSISWAATTRSLRSSALRRNEGRVAITALHGLRGVGKTTLAAAYAERHRGDYRATWWIRAQTESTMRADLVALGVRFSWVERTTRRSPRS